MPSARIDRPKAVFWLQALSLAATAWVVWKFAVGPHVDRRSLAAVLRHALLMASAAALWGAVITLVLMVTIARMERRNLLQVTLRTSSAAIWFAPATILMTSSSPIYLAAALALVVSATRLLYAQWRIAKPLADPPAESVLVLSSGGLGSGFLPRNPLMAMAAGLSIQAGISAALLGASGLMAAWFSLAVAILTVYSTSAGLIRDEQPTLPESAFGFVLTILLAAGLTVTGLGGGREGYGGAEANGQPQGAPRGQAVKLPNYGVAKNGDFPGVILRPEKRAVPLLVEPIPARGKFAQRSPDRPFPIPFDGEYWVYRWPFPKPPAGSFIYHGSPTNVSYRTTDEMPLRMDAHQFLDREIDLSCCSRIEIEILNADIHPNTVLMELLVADRGGRPVSLGIQPVNSQPNGSGRPVSETLAYDTQPRPFDEIKVQFLRKQSRTGRSARIAISRFLLIPR